MTEHGFSFVLLVAFIWFGASEILMVLTATILASEKVNGWRGSWWFKKGQKLCQDIDT
jgi:hypothetical protein